MSGVGSDPTEPARFRTIDDEQTCVRCGAPEWHCWCEDVGPDGHWWVAPSIGANNTEWTVCMKCGNIQRQDGKPSSACRGPVKVALRGAPVPSPTPPTTRRATRSDAPNWVQRWDIVNDAWADGYNAALDSPEVTAAFALRDAVIAELAKLRETDEPWGDLPRRGLTEYGQGGLAAIESILRAVGVSPETPTEATR